VPGLPGDVDDVAAFLDEQRHEAVSEVVGPHTGQTYALACAPPDIAVPRLPVRVVPDLSARTREDERVVVRASGDQAPPQQIGGQRSEQPDGA
jgi:hypothetical protein